MRILFYLFKAIAIAVSKMVVKNNGAIPKQFRSQSYATIASWLVKSDSVCTKSTICVILMFNKSKSYQTWKKEQACNNPSGYYGSCPNLG